MWALSESGLRWGDLTHLLAAYKDCGQTTQYEMVNTMPLQPSSGGMETQMRNLQFLSEYSIVFVSWPFYQLLETFINVHWATPNQD